MNWPKRCRQNSTQCRPWSDCSPVCPDLPVRKLRNNTVIFNCMLRSNIVDIILNKMHPEPRHDKTNKMNVRPAKTQIGLGIRPVWSESSLSAWSKLGSLATHWVHSQDSDQTGRMPRLIWVFAGRTVTLLVLSCRGSPCGKKISRSA